MNDGESIQRQAYSIAVHRDEANIKITLNHVHVHFSTSDLSNNITTDNSVSTDSLCDKILILFFGVCLC